MRKALITGGAGFIGSHVAEYLASDGWKVRVLDNLSSGSRENLTGVPCDFVLGDIRDADACRQACRDVDAVFHLGAMVTVAGSITDPVRCNDVNVTGTLNMLCAARESGVRRFVFSSSASVYGNSELPPTCEDAPLSPESPYATSKACGEFFARNFSRLYGLETVVLRYFNVYGPRQSDKSDYAAVIPKFVRAAVTGARPVVFGDGLQTRDFVFVRDVAQANYRAAVATYVSGATYNVGSGEEITLLDLLSVLSKVSGKELAPRFEEGRPGEVRYSRSEIERARRDLGYMPVVGLVDGLRQVYAHVAGNSAGRDAGQVTPTVSGS